MREVRKHKRGPLLLRMRSPEMPGVRSLPRSRVEALHAITSLGVSNENKLKQAPGTKLKYLGADFSSQMIEVRLAIDNPANWVVVS